MLIENLYFYELESSYKYKFYFIIFMDTNCLIKIVIYNYITNYNRENEYNTIKNNVLTFLEKHPELKSEHNIKKYILSAKKHMNTIQKKVGQININLEKYDKLMSEIDTISDNIENLQAGNIDDFLQNVMEIKKDGSKSDELYFIVDNDNKLQSKLNELRDNLYLELNMNYIL